MMSCSMNRPDLTDLRFDLKVACGVSVVGGGMIYGF